MDTNRLFKIILTELSLDRLKLDEELERLVNSNDETLLKISRIKHLLREMSLIDLSIVTFTSMTNNDNNK